MSAISVYFVNRAVRFTDTPCSGSGCYAARDNEPISLAKVIKIFETFNEIAVYDSSGERFERFAADFKRVEAAGGLVVNPLGEMLMIHLNNHWDLPKGHIEAGETPEQCAVREIGEETGIVGAKIDRPLCNTMHAYNVYGVWELKRTHWFALSTDERREPRPQSEEGIASAAWCTASQAARNLQQSYPTIHDVFRNFLNCQ